MALTLPPNFANDVSGRDTALVPVIILTTPDVQLYISTNSFQFGNKDIKPLLLNIPSLKESIDIEKRAYRISAINITISNFPYKNTRFSELISDNSIINSELELWWVSPSGEYKGESGGISPDEMVANEINAKWFKVFYGPVRRYKHDNEKVSITVEDKSQLTLDKELPSFKHHLLGIDVPDKFKNKIVPIVYGEVTRSPCVIKSSPEIDEWGIGV